MEIIRVEDDVEKSTIDGCAVADLPDGLKAMMVAVLAKMPRVKRINVSDNASCALFELADKNVVLGYFHGIEIEFLKTIELLLWYQGPHWHGSYGGGYGAPVHCAHCGYQSTPGAVHGDKCPIPSCLSHEKWRQIIGPSYKPPTESPHRIPESFSSKRKGKKSLFSRIVKIK